MTAIAEPPKQRFYCDNFVDRWPAVWFPLPQYRRRLL